MRENQLRRGPNCNRLSRLTSATVSSMVDVLWNGLDAMEIPWEFPAIRGPDPREQMVVMRAALAIPAHLAQVLLRALWRRGAVTSLDHVRGHFSHEPAAKITRLTALLAEWRHGRYHPDDPADASQILTDLQAGVLDQAPLLAARVPSLVRACRVLGAIASARHMLGPALRQRTLSLTAIARIGRTVNDLGRWELDLADSVSHAHAARLEDLVTQATDEVRREIGGGLRQGTVGIVLDDRGHAGATWVPHADAAQWCDVLRNLIRNAVQATEERGVEPRALVPHPPVRVRLAPLVGRSGSRVEIIDEGVGLKPEQIPTIWDAGVSRHAQGRGWGLTPRKREFVEGRGTVAISSAPGSGTTIRIDVPAAEVHIPRPSALIPRLAVALPLLLVIGVLTATAIQRPRDIATVERVDPSIVRTLDARGVIVWNTDLHEPVLRNLSGGFEARADGWVRQENPHLVCKDHHGRLAGILVATQPEQGPSRLHMLGPDSRELWVRPLVFQRPTGVLTGRSTSDWQAIVRWGGRVEPVAAVAVRDRWERSSTAQFITLTGDSLGAYYHPGHLCFGASGDLDGDGRGEVLLYGVNNFAQYDRSVVPDSCLDYVDCVIVLEPPAVQGQAWPYRDWPTMPPAREEGYLLVPPLDPQARQQISRIDVVGAGIGARAVEVRVTDGRICILDGRARPLACAFGDYTPAESLAVGQSRLPFVYFAQGVRSDIEVPIIARHP
jgi:signal transduction histidine kinase